MILKLTAGLCLYMILMLWLIRLNKDSGISREQLIRLTLYGIFGALLSTLIGLIVGINGHLKGWRPAGSLVSLAFSAWIMKGLTEQTARYIALRMGSRSEEMMTWFDAVFFGAVIGTAFGLGKGIAELFETGSTLLGIVRELLPVHFAAGVWTGWLYGKGIRTNNPVYTAGAFILPALVQGLYEFLISYHFAENGMWYITFIGTAAAAAGAAFTVLCLLRWKNRKNMNELSA